MRIAALFALASLSIPGMALAGEVAGTAYDANGLPASGVHVSIDGTSLQAVTGEDGSYRIADVAEGAHRIAVDRGEGAVQFVPIKVAGDAPVKRNIFLLSDSFVDEARHDAVPNEMVAEAMNLAAQMTAQADRAQTVAWRWNDNEG